MDVILEQTLFNVGARQPHLRDLAAKAIKGDRQAFNTLRLNANFEGHNGQQMAALHSYFAEVKT